MKSRLKLIAVISVTAATTSIAFCLSSQATFGDDTAKIIKISARRFEFSPSEIKIIKGQPVVLQLTTEDRLHGFNIPAMNLRTDIQPGKVSELRVAQQKTGDFDFFCDVFCGSGHEGMSGKIHVVEK